MLLSLPALVLMTSMLVEGQRPFFAGSRPIGFPDTPNRTTTTQDPLGNRFGEGTTQRLPIEANGDRDLVDRLSKLPLDKQPFWFINWQALEANRNKPQTYPQRPNSFIDNVPIVSTTSRISDTGLNNRFSNENPVGFSNPVNSGFVNNNGFSNNANTNGNAGPINTGILNTAYPNTVYTSTGFQSVKPNNLNANVGSPVPAQNVYPNNGQVNPGFVPLNNNRVSSNGVPIKQQTDIAFANGASSQSEFHNNRITTPNGGFVTSFNHSNSHQAYTTYAWKTTTTKLHPNSNDVTQNQGSINRNGGFEQTTYPFVPQNSKSANRYPVYYP